MDKITTPIAVLISGVLIFIGLYLNYSNGKYYVHDHRGSNGFQILTKINIHTGETCTTSRLLTKKWDCTPENLN